MTCSRCTWSTNTYSRGASTTFAGRAAPAHPRLRQPHRFEHSALQSASRRMRRIVALSRTRRPGRCSNATSATTRCRTCKLCQRRWRSTWVGGVHRRRRPDGGPWPRATGLRRRSQKVSTVALSDYLAEPVETAQDEHRGSRVGGSNAPPRPTAQRPPDGGRVHGFPECGQHLHDISGTARRLRIRYVLHHFDYETNGAVRPPFRIDAQTRFFTLIAAMRVRDDAVAFALRPQPGDGPEPLSRTFGFDRGHADRPALRGGVSGGVSGRHPRARCWRLVSAAYTQRFGEPRVEQSDVLNVREHTGDNDRGADLNAGSACVPAAAYDCLILTQTLPFIFDGAQRDCKRFAGCSSPAACCC